MLRPTRAQSWTGLKRLNKSSRGRSVGRDREVIGGLPAPLVAPCTGFTHGPCFFALNTSEVAVGYFGLSVRNLPQLHACSYFSPL